MTSRYADRMTVQLVTRIPDDMVAAVDDLVRTGVYDSRSHAVRDGLAAVISHQRRAAIGAAIADGYRRRPQQAGDELGWPDAASAAMIADEPW